MNWKEIHSERRRHGAVDPYAEARRRGASHREALWARDRYYERLYGRPKTRKTKRAQGPGLVRKLLERLLAPKAAHEPDRERRQQAQAQAAEIDRIVRQAEEAYWDRRAAELVRRVRRGMGYTYSPLIEAELNERRLNRLTDRFRRL